MKKLFISLIMMLGFMGSMVAMEPGEPVSAFSSFGQAYEGTITVQTSDGQNFTISKEIAKQMPTLNALVEDIGAEQAIPLPTITGKIFDWIVQNLMILQENPKAQIDMQTLRGFTVDELIDLIRACEYLHTDKLLNALFKIFDERGRVIGHSLTSTYIKIITEDNQEFVIPLEIAKQISVIKGMIRDIGESAVIPLPTVKGEAFNWIARTLLMFNKNPNAQINTQELSVEQLIELVNACEYLDLDHLENRLFKVLNERNLFEGSALENMSSIGLRKFWMWHSAYSYLSSVRLHEELIVDIYSRVIMSPDERALIVQSFKLGIIEIWDLNTGEQLFENLLHEGVYRVIISRDGSKLISSSRHAGTIKIWDLNTGIQLFEDLLHEDVEEVIISPDGNKLISWSRDTGIIKIWDLNTGMQLFEDLLYERVTEVIISPDGRNMIAWSRDNRTIKIWDLNTGQIFKALSHEELAPRFSLSGVVISPDGSKFISYGNSYSWGIIKVWNLKTGTQLLGDLSHSFVNRFTISSDGSKLISWSEVGGIIKIWDLNTGMQLFEDLLHEDVEEVIISPDGNKLISWSEVGGIIKIWDLKTGTQIFEDLLHERVYEVIISHDGSKLISWSSNKGIIKIWDLKTGMQLFEDLLHERVYKVIISRNGSKLISSSMDNPNHGIVKIWDLIQPPNDLNSDQIKLMMWLYENRNNGNAKLSLELNDAYESLSDSLKLLLSEKFPISKLLKSGVEVELEPVPQQEPEQAEAQVPQLEQPLIPQVPQQDVEQVVPQQQPEQEQPQLPQQVQQEAELIQPQVPEQVQPEGQQAPRQPSLWQRWLNLFRTRLWTAPS